MKGRVAFAVLLLFTPALAQAIPLPVDVDWFATSDVPPAFFWSSIGPADSGPFTFVSPSSVDVYITDDFLSGDRFEIFDFGISLGLTSVPTFLDSGEKGPAVAFLDPDYSHGVFTVGAGAHSISIEIEEGSFESGRGYIKAETSVPEPTTVALMGLGLLGLASLKRRSR